MAARNSNCRSSRTSGYSRLPCEEGGEDNEFSPPSLRLSIPILMSTSASPPRRIAILCAVAQEAAPIRKLLERAERFHLAGLPQDPPHDTFPIPCWEGTKGRHDILLTVSGMGAHRAAATARRVLNTWTPDLLLVAGVAGALDPELQVSDVIAANQVVTPRRTLAPALVLPAHRPGSLLSLNQVLVSAAEKQETWKGFEEPRPLAVEMETAVVAAVAEKQDVPWAALRTISDTAGEGLPLDFNKLRSKDGDLPTSRVALAAIRQPSSIPGLIRLGGNTSRAAEALARAIEAWLA